MRMVGHGMKQIIVFHTNFYSFLKIQLMRLILINIGIHNSRIWQRAHN